MSCTPKLREDTQRDRGPSCFVGGHWHRPTGGILTPGFIALLKMLAPPFISACSSFAGSRQGWLPVQGSYSPSLGLYWLSWERGSVSSVGRESCPEQAMDPLHHLPMTCTHRAATWSPRCHLLHSVPPGIAFSQGKGKKEQPWSNLHGILYS